MRKLESIKFQECTQLVGGFSEVFQINEVLELLVITNNCHGGICSAIDTVKHKHKKHIPKAGTNNCHKNCAHGCGNTL